jgi:hypothetical protein
MCKIGTKGDMYEGVMGCIRDMVDDALDEQPVKSASLGSSVGQAFQTNEGQYL